MHEDYLALTFAGIVLVGFACQWLAWRMRLPAILFLLVVGLTLGPITGAFNPHDLLGELLFPFISLAVAIILFEGSLTLNFKQIRGVGKTVWSIVLLGSLVSWAITSVATHWLLGFDWSLALLFGSLTVVTGPTVIVPLLRSVRPTGKLANILRWEGILIDPLGALFVVVVYEFIVSSNSSDSVQAFVLILLVGFIGGCMVGFIMAWLLRHRKIPEYLQPFAMLAVVLGMFSLSNLIESEAGLLTVTVMGIWLANAKDVNIQSILHFKEHLTVLLISGLFILLAARIEASDFYTLGWQAAVLFGVIQLLSRPLSIFIATVGSSLSLKEKGFLAWVAPRGIVAASISALFALKLDAIGVEGATLLVPLTFMVIIGTVFLQSVSARAIALRLQVAEPSPRGFLFIGANEVARQLAQALSKYESRVIVSDSNCDYIREARMAGLLHYYGNPISSHADEYLDLIGVGHVVAVSPDKHFNTIACMHFDGDFDGDKLFCLNNQTKNKQSDKHQVTDDYHGNILFDGEVSYKKLASLLSQGAEIKHTTISDEFSYQDYLNLYADKYVLPLFNVNDKGRVFFCYQGDKREVQAGDTLVALIQNY